MKLTIGLLLVSVFISQVAQTQDLCGTLYDKKFTLQEVEQDFEFIQNKILNAHANPFTGVTKEEFEKKCIEIKNQLKDNMTQREFYFVIKPIFQLLEDEHACLAEYCIPDSLKKTQNNNSPLSQPKEKLPPFSYKKIGKYGYLSVNTFDDNSTFPVETWKKKIDSLYSQIKKDKVRKLIIDVHHNSGGNSEIGNYLIDGFSDKTYKTYEGKWKKSQEYSDFLKGYGYVDSIYESIPNGGYYDLEAQQISPGKRTNRFTGKTYVVVGNNTFSSALMFCTIVLDNQLAEVVGEIPEKGHPNHFGELIIFQTPYTQLEFWFGVKIWIRPAGLVSPNKLIPKKIIDLDGKDEKDIIEEILK